MDTSPLGPILCIFNWDDVREGNIDPARHLFCEELLTDAGRAEALLGTVQIRLPAILNG